MTKMVWLRDPNSGGKKISPEVRSRVTRRIERYAEEHYAGRYTRLGIRFRAQFCYIDAYTEPQEPPAKLLELRGETREEYFGVHAEPADASLPASLFRRRGCLGLGVLYL